MLHRRAMFRNNVKHGGDEARRLEDRKRRATQDRQMFLTRVPSLIRLLSGFRR